MRKPVIVFDMNETLLDLSALDSTFGRIFGEAEGAELRKKPGGVLLVAAHAWDITGALAAGCRAAFVERPEKALNPATSGPEITARDITDLAGQIIAKYA